MEKHSKIYLKNYSPPAYEVLDTQLQVDLFDTYARVSSKIFIRRSFTHGADSDSSLSLAGENLQLDFVKVSGVALLETDYTVDAKSLTLHTVPHFFVLEIGVTIFPEKNKALTGLYASNNNICSQCEPHGFRRITYFLDRPDVMTRFTTIITADKYRYPYLLSNGNLVERRELGDRHWVKWEDPSLKPCYLFALVAGDFDCIAESFITRSGRRVGLQLYLEKGFLSQARHALDSLKRAMQWDEETWSCEYDLDQYMIVAVSDFNMGAMENKGLNIFNTKYVLAQTDTATDQDYCDIAAVIGHEYFHNWSGNRVTCRDWFQITLKEGLTVFRDQCFSSDLYSPAIARIPEVRIMKEKQFLEDASPLSHPIRPESYIEVNNFYTLTVYRKGAEVVRMLQTFLGKALFKKAIEHYFSRYDGQAVTTEDFITAIEAVSGRDFSQFKRWYSTAGTPLINITVEYETETRSVVLSVEQGLSGINLTTGQALHFPLAIGFVGTTGEVLAPYIFPGVQQAGESTYIIDITEPKSVWRFEGFQEKPSVSLFRNFSAPVSYACDRQFDELFTLFSHDTDAVARWEVGQRLFSRAIIEKANTAASSGWGGTQVYSGILACIKHILHTEEDLALVARLVALPSLESVLVQAPSVQRDTVVAAYFSLYRTLGSALQADFLSVYQHCSASIAPYKHSTQEIGKRSLRGICLFYLLYADSAQFVELAVSQYHTAQNMTDRYTALYAINEHDMLERVQLLADFYQKWSQEPLLVNKWLSLQALAPLPETLNTVQTLWQHAAFSIENPNNVHALLGGFTANTVCFHSASGAGYTWLTDCLLQIDKFNPQLAARWAQPLTLYKQVDKERSEKMRSCLLRIVEHTPISEDLYEVAYTGSVSG